MQVLLRVQPQEKLTDASAYQRKKYLKAIEKLSRLKGDIKRMKGYDALYRFKNKHCRIHFTVDAIGNFIITAILSKADYLLMQEDLP